MPVYVVHGFRWARAGNQGIRVFVVLNNIDDAAPEYIQQAKTSRALLKTFQKSFPSVMKHLPKLQFIEQYDPEDTTETAVSQPYAFVADKVVECGLSANVENIISEGPGQNAQSWEAMADLRDALSPESKIGWWVVYNGDPERAYPHGEDEEEQEMEEIEEEPEEEVETVDLPSRPRQECKTSSQTSPRSSLTKKLFRKKNP
jgi:hypothetical protein